MQYMSSCFQLYYFCFQNVTLIGAEVDVKHLKLLQLAAVSCHRTEVLNISESQHVFEPKDDKNIKIVFPPETFQEQPTVSTKVS